LPKLAAKFFQVFEDGQELMVANTTDHIRERPIESVREADIRESDREPGHCYECSVFAFSNMVWERESCAKFW